MDFRVGELFNLLDLQAAVFVGDDVSDEDRFAGHLDPNRSLRLVGDLQADTRLLSRCGVDQDVWNTDVSDDLSRSLYYRVDGRLREGLSHREWGLVAANTTYLVLCPEADDPRERFKPLLSALLWPTYRSRIGDMAIILVQGLRNNVQIYLFESMTPLVHESDLWGFGAFWIGHWNEGIDGELR